MKSPLTKAPRTDIDSSHKLCYTLYHGVIGLTMIQDRSLLPLVYSLCDKSGFCKTCNLKVGLERKRGHRHLAIYRSVLSIAPNIVSFANLLLVFCLCLSIEINHYLGIFYDMPTHRPRVLFSENSIYLGPYASEPKTDPDVHRILRFTLILYIQPAPPTP